VGIGNMPELSHDAACTLFLELMKMKKEALCSLVWCLKGLDQVTNEDNLKWQIAMEIVFKLSHTSVDHREFAPDPNWIGVLEHAADQQVEDAADQQVEEEQAADQQVEDAADQQVEEEQAADQQVFEIEIELFTGKKKKITVHAGEEIRAIKAIVHFEEGIPSSMQEISFEGRPLEDNKTLSDYNIHHGMTLDVSLVTHVFLPAVHTQGEGHGKGKGKGNGK
jgi:hypothetical protein